MITNLLDNNDNPELGFRQEMRRFEMDIISAARGHNGTL